MAEHLWKPYLGDCSGLVGETTWFLWGTSPWKSLGNPHWAMLLALMRPSNNLYLNLPSSDTPGIVAAWNLQPLTEPWLTSKIISIPPW